MSIAPQKNLILPRPPTIMDRFRALLARRETIRYLVFSSLRANHRDKALGKLWSLLDPMLFMLAYLVVFGFSFKQIHSEKGVGEFVIYLLCGVLPWRFHEASIASATGCIRANRGLIHEINFPKAVFPTALVLAKLNDFLWGLAALLILYLILRPQDISLAAIGFPVVLAIQIFFTLGFAFVAAYLGAFFADTSNVLAAALRFWFFFSPIFYRISGEDGIIPPKYVTLYMLNPMACFMEAYRDCLLRQQLPNPAHLAYVAILSAALFVGGFILFSRGEGHFAKHV